MALSKKHFIAIAARINEQVESIRNNEKDQAGDEHGYALSYLESLARDLCVDFRAENANFDGQRFLKACGF